MIQEGERGAQADIWVPGFLEGELEQSRSMGRGELCKCVLGTIFIRLLLKTTEYLGFRVGRKQDWRVHRSQISHECFGRL